MVRTNRSSFRLPTHLLGVVLALAGCSSGGTGKQGAPPDTASPRDSGIPPTDTGDTGSSLAPFDAALAADLQAALQAYVDDAGVAGLALAVRMPDTEPLVLAVGMADRDAEVPLALDDRHCIASITKTFTAELILQLVDDGALGLDDALTDHVDVLDNDDGITIRHLLQHTAGVPEYTAARAFLAASDQPWTDTELMALIADAERVHPPGEGWSYSNSHYVLLGMVAEAVVGVSWADQVRERHLVALGLDDTEVPSDDWGDIVQTYYGAHVLDDLVSPSGIGAAGNMTATVADLAAWGEAFGRGDLLSADTFASQQESRTMIARGFAWYGLGMMMVGDALDDPELELGHNGAFNGSAGWVGYRPSRGTTLALLGNTWRRTGTTVDYQYPLTWSRDLWALIEAAHPR